MSNMLTDDIDDLVVEIKRDKGNRQQSQVELEDTSDSVYVLVPVRTDVRQFTI